MVKFEELKKQMSQFRNINELMGESFSIVGVSFKTLMFGDVALIDVAKNGEPMGEYQTGSEVLLDQCRRIIEPYLKVENRSVEVALVERTSDAGNSYYCFE